MPSIVWLILLCFITRTAISGEVVPPTLMIAGNQARIMEKGKLVRKYPTRGLCQDAWFLENGDVLVTEQVGVTKFDAGGNVIMRYTAAGKKNEVHTCQPLPGGGVLVGESGPARLLELDASGKIVKEVMVRDIKFQNPHLHMRGARKNRKGEYGIISSGEMRLIILKPDGATKRIIDLQKLPKSIKHRYAHSIAFLDNGNLLVSTSYGSCFVELDGDGNMVWSLTPEDLPELGLKYAAGMQRLANGNTICTAYKSKYPIFEVTPDKQIVWKIAAGKALGHPLHVQVIKGDDKPSSFGLQK